MMVLVFLLNDTDIIVKYIGIFCVLFISQFNNGELRNGGHYETKRLGYV